MSWTDVFPVLTDEMVDEYESSATPQVRQELKDLFEVERVLNQQDVPHIISVSLFWKNGSPSTTDHGARNLNTFKGGGAEPLPNYNPWKQYAKPIIVGALSLRSTRQDICFRVYLAADLGFLLDDLVAAGCEVYLMKATSVSTNPGIMWRFLAFQEANKLVTLLDADRSTDPEPYILLTEQAAGVGLGFWRIPVWGDLSKKGGLIYRPVCGSYMGCLRPLPTRLLMESLIWQTRSGGIQKMARLPGLVPKMIRGTEWTDQGFDEWFLQAALYPRFAFEGILTFIPVWARSRLLPLDIEYCTWANPQSELIYHGSFTEYAEPAPTKKKSASRVSQCVPTKPHNPIAGRRREFQARRDERPEYAVLLYLAQKDDGVEVRQMLSLLVSSLVKTEFAGDILLWREQGPRVIRGPQSSEVKERLGHWASAQNEFDFSHNDLMHDQTLSKYGRVLLLRPGTLACRNLEYLLVADEAMLVIPGMTVADTPLLVFTPPKKLPRNGRVYPKSKVKSLERGAVVMAKAREKGTFDGTIICITEKRPEDQLLGVWQAWLGRFAPEEAEALGQLFSDTRIRIQSPTRSRALT